MHGRSGAERRTARRTGCDAAIRIENPRTGEESTGRIYNFSSGGAYIEASRPLEPGSVLRIVVKRFGLLPPFVEFQGSVRWSEEIQGAVVLHGYGAGVRFVSAPRRRRKPPRFRVIAGGAE
jgi:hypothetical protein